LTSGTGVKDGTLLRRHPNVLIDIDNAEFRETPLVRGLQRPYTKHISQMSADEAIGVLVNTDLHLQIASGDLEEFVYFGLSVYGTTNQEALIQPLIHLYGIFVEKTGAEIRKRPYQAVAEQAKEGDITVNALLPFIGSEPDHSLVSTAVIDYCMFRQTAKDQPFAGVGDVLGMLKSSTVICPGGILAGLLLLGDARVSALLPAFRQQLENADIAVLARTHSGFLYAPMIGFYLEWLEELSEPATEAEFGTLASGLVNMVQRDQYGVVVAVERLYGQPTADETVIPVEHYGFREYFNSILPRMQAIAELETDPKVMPEVITRWAQHARCTELNG